PVALRPTLCPYTTLFRSHHRQLLLRHGHRAALVAIDDGDRAAPVALAADAPVAQAEVDLACAVAVGFETGSQGGECGVEIHAAVDRKSTRLNSSHVKISY